jgi:hypothetical protein
MGDSVVNIQINATASDAKAQIASTGDALKDLSAALGLAGGDARIFETVLADDVKAGIALTDTLAQLTKGGVEVDDAVKTAAKSALQLAESYGITTKQAGDLAGAANQLVVAIEAKTKAVTASTAADTAASTALDNQAAAMGKAAAATKTAQTAAVDLGAVFNGLVTNIENETRAAMAATAAHASMGAGLDALAENMARSAVIAETTGATTVNVIKKEDEAIVENEVFWKKWLETIKEVMTEGSEVIAEFVEKAELGSLSVGSAFGAMSSVIGASVAASLGMEMLHRFQEQVESLHKLSEATGATVAQISELRGAMENVGVHADSANSAITRLSRMAYMAAQGSQAAVRAFNQMGISVAGWKEHIPSAIDLLTQMADKVSASEEKTRILGVAMRVMGGASREMVAFLSQGSESIKEQMEALEYMGRADEGAVESVKALTREEANLSHEFHALVADVFPYVVMGFKALDTVARLVVLTFKDLGRLIIGVWNVFADVLNAETGAAAQVLKGNFTGAWQTIKGGAALATADWSAAMDGIQKDAESTKAAIDRLWEKPGPEKKVKMPPELDETTGNLKKQQAEWQRYQEAIIDGQQKHAKAMLELEKAGIEERAKINHYDAAARIAMVQAVEDRELVSMKNFIDRKIALIASDPDKAAEVQKLLNEKQALDDAYVAHRQKNTAEIAEDEGKREAILMASTAKVDKAIQAAAVKTMDATAKQQAETWKKQLTEIEAAHKEELAGQEAQAKQMFALRKAEADLELAEGNITAGQHMEILKKLHEDEYNEQLKALNDRLALLTGGNTDIAAVQAKLNEMMKAPVGTVSGAFLKPEEVQKVVNQILAITGKFHVEEIDQQKAAVEKETSLYKKAFDPIATAFDTTIKGMMQGTLTFSQAWHRMGQNILASWINTMIQAELRHAESLIIRGLREAGFSKLLVALHLEDAAVHSATEGTKTAVTAANVAARSAMEEEGASRSILATIAVGIKDIAVSAARAAAATWAAISAIPVIGPFLAPAAAAAALAAVLHFAGAFQYGGITDTGGLAMLHPHEMVLPERISNFVQDAATGAGYAGSRGDIHYHAAPGESPDSIRANKQVLYDVIRKGFRTGELRAG